MCVASLIAALAGWTFLPLIGTFTGLALGLIGLRRVKRSGEQGRGLAIAGIWISAVQLGLFVFAILAVLVLFLLVWIPIWMNMPGYEMKTKTMEIDAPVRELYVSGLMTVKVVDDGQPIRISARAWALDQVSIDQREGVMRIGMVEGHHWRGGFYPDNITITLSSQALSKLDARGAVTVVCDSMAESSPGAVAIKGRGTSDIRIKRLEARKATVALLGLSHVDIDGGEVDSLVVSVAGSADFDSTYLKAARVDASVLGSGSVKVHATEEFHGAAAGIGDIDVYGHPPVYERTVLGGGGIDLK